MSRTRRTPPVRPLALATAAALLFVTASAVYATWSIIAVDRRTGQVVVASATCVP